MNSALMFSKASDEWSTPQAFFDALHAEFHFTVDGAATAENTKCADYWSAADTWREGDWRGHVVWLNPPYSKVYAFMRRAQAEAAGGATVVCLVPSRTDTRWWHDLAWDGERHQPRAGVEVRFVRGRLKFGDGKNSAPFPSVVIIFRGQAR